MDISALSTLGSQLPMDAVKPGDKGMAEVASALESVFASMLVKEMRNSLSEGFFGSEKSDVMGGLFDTHIGDAIAGGAGLGIKQMILRQVEQKAHVSPNTGSVEKEMQ